MNSSLNQYWLFAGLQYDIEGGMKDFQGSYISAENAEAAGVRHQKRHPNEYAWWHIVDSNTGTIIKEY